MGKLDGKISVITGGATGIGKGCVECFFEEGSKIAIFDLKDEESHAMVKEMNTKKEGFASVYVGDVSDPEDVTNAFAHFRKELGKPDILLNNAGYDELVPIEKMTLSQWSRMLEVHLTATFLCTQQVMADMKTAGWGRIINFSSQLSHKGQEEMSHYCAAKGAVNAFTKSLAYELSDSGVLANCINPGPIWTPLLDTLGDEWIEYKKSQLPTNRIGHVSEVVPSVLLLASNDGGFYQGATLNMNGGDYMI